MPCAPAIICRQCSTISVSVMPSIPGIPRILSIIAPLPPIMPAIGPMGPGGDAGLGVSWAATVAPVRNTAVNNVGKNIFFIALASFHPDAGPHE
jgi:hypothetical protein